VINLGHPLTDAQRAQIVTMSGQQIEREIFSKVQFDPELSFSVQSRELVEQIGLGPQDWQQTPLLINPPTLNFIAITVLAELHGRMGYFPPVLRLRQVPNSLPPAFEVAEIINLQEVRDSSRKLR